VDKALHRFERVARFLAGDPKWMTREVAGALQRALDL
jgi:hypothetical protein